MMKKNELIEALGQGCYIYMDDQSRRAIVYSNTDERLDSCRYDTADNLARLGGYDAVSLGAWSFARRIEDTEARQAAREAAARELDSIRTPGHIEIQAKNDCWIGNNRVTKGRRYIITVYGDGTQEQPGNAYGNLYDFRTHEHAIYFEILSRPEAARETANNTEEEKTMTGEEKKITRQNIHTAVELHQQHRWTGPVETVAALVLTLGYPAAVETVATLVNSVGDWDGRISTEARTWAADRATDRETLRAAGIYQPCEIHPAHIDQIAREMMAYAPAWDDQEEAPAEEIATEEPAEDTRKAAALAAYLVEYENFTEDEAAEIERNYDGSFSCGSWEYQVMTDEEADEAARAEILESMWAFRPSFVVMYTEFYKTASGREVEQFCAALGRIQEELCESATPIIRALIEDLDEFVSDAIRADGRGHFISRYDGDEIDLGEFYAYRQN